MIIENGNPELPKEPTPVIETAPKVEAPATSVEDPNAGWQKRVDKLTWKAKELERQLQERDKAWEEKFKKAEEKANPRQFKDDAERLEYYIQAKVNEELNKKEQEQGQAKSIEEKTSKIATRIQSSLQKTAEMYPDSEDVISNHHEPLPEAAFRFVAKSDVSGLLSYKIAKDPSILEKINDFDDESDLTRYLTKLELKCEAELESYEAKKSAPVEIDEPEAKSVRDIPKPIDKLTPKGSSVKAKEIDPAKDLSAWIKMRNEAENEKKRKLRGGK